MKLANAKKYRQFVCGAIVGIVASISVPVFATNVTVVVDNTIRLLIAGEYRTLPDEYEMLNYKGRTYLPSRFVAEQLGSQVSWDEPSRTITITKPKAEVVEKIVEVPVEVEKIVYVDRPVAESSTNYRLLPVEQTYDNVMIRLRTIHNVSNSYSEITRISCEIENMHDQYRAMVDYSNAELTVEGNTYRTVNAPATAWDSKLMYEDIMRDTTVSGFFVFPRVSPGTHEFTLRVPVRMQGAGTVNEYEMKFYATINE